MLVAEQRCYVRENHRDQDPIIYTKKKLYIPVYNVFSKHIWACLLYFAVILYVHWETAVRPS